MAEHDIMLSLLKLAEDGEERSIQEAISNLATSFELTGEELLEFSPNGKYSVFSSQVRQALAQLKKVGLLETARMSHFVITEQGLEALEKSASLFEE